MPWEQAMAQGDEIPVTIIYFCQLKRRFLRLSSAREDRKSLECLLIKSWEAGDQGYQGAGKYATINKFKILGWECLFHFSKFLGSNICFIFKQGN